MKKSVAIRCGFALVMAAAAGARAAESGTPQGWSVKPAGSAHSCIADGPRSGSASISIWAEGPQPWLLISAPEFPAGKAIKRITLVEGDRHVDFMAQLASHTYGVIITRELSDQIENLRTLTAIIDEKTYWLQTPNLGHAIDAALRCAGMESRAAIWAAKPIPIAGAPGWVIHDHVQPAGTCMVRRNGDEIDTSIALGQNGALILSIGKPQWLAMSSVSQVTLQIDAQSPVPLQAGAFENVVVAPITDPQLVGALTEAATLTWQLPNGTYHAAVGGIGKAVEALRLCERARPGTNAKPAL